MVGRESGQGVRTVQCAHGRQVKHGERGLRTLTFGSFDSKTSAVLFCLHSCFHYREGLIDLLNVAGIKVALKLEKYRGLVVFYFLV